MNSLENPMNLGIGDALTWNVGFRYFIARVHDWHPRGVIVKLGGKYQDIPWEFFDDKEWQTVTAEDIRRFSK